MKHRLLVIAPTGADTAELSRPEVTRGIDIIFQPYQETYFERILSTGKAGSYELTSPGHHIHDLHALCQEQNITAVFSSDDYPGCLYTSIIARERHLIGPSTQALLQCSHKYLARVMQQKVVPDATPAFELLAPYATHLKSLSFPVFVKPVKSYFSVNAGPVSTLQELSKKTHDYKMPDEFLYQFNWFLRHYGATEYDGRSLIAEELLQGHQVTVEGYICNGKVHILGVTDSIMYPGTISFEKFVYPSNLPDSVQAGMHQYAKQAVLGAYLNNTFFNVEFMYNPKTDRIFIIEINPRMAQLFGDLYEKVDGTNAYTYAVQVALGIQPTPTIKQGKHKRATSFVMRTFEDKLVVKVPTPQDIEKLTREIPDIRVYVYAQEGKRLSYFIQDGSSYRYMLVHLGGNDAQELEEKKEYCLAQLPFVFA